MEKSLSSMSSSVKKEMKQPTLRDPKANQFAAVHMRLTNGARCSVAGISAVVKVKMVRTVAPRAAKRVKTVNNSNDRNDDSIAAVAVSTNLVVVSIAARAKKAATLAKVVTVSSKAVARRMFAMADRIATARDDTSVAISVAVVEVAAAAAVVVRDVRATMMAVKVDRKRMAKMVVKEVRRDVAIHGSVVRCVGSKMAMLMVLRMVVNHYKIQQLKVPLKLHDHWRELFILFYGTRNINNFISPHRFFFFV